MKVIETVGKDIEQALNLGLAELGCKLDDVEVKILVHPGIFRKAKVQLTYAGNDGTVEKKTAAAVMRNLEARAKNAGQTGGQKNRPDRKADGSRRDSRPANGQAAAGSQNGRAGQNGTPDGAKSDNRRTPAEKPQAERSAQGKGANEQASGFRRDFRAELEAAGGVPADKPKKDNAADKPNRENKPQNKPKQEPRKPQVKEPLSPETVAAAQEKAVAYLKKVAALMGVETDCECEVKDGDVNIRFTSSDDMLIGFRGETIEALEYLATLAANESDGKYVHFNLDAGDYRAHRSEMIVQNALARADKAVATGRRTELEPMSSANRRIVHAALGERTDVITRSEGKEPNRYIVIIPKRNGQNGGGKPNGQNNNRKKYRNNQGRNPNRGNGAAKDSGKE